MNRRLSCLLLALTVSLSCRSDPVQPAAKEPDTNPNNDPPRAVLTGTDRMVEGWGFIFSARDSFDPDGDSLRYRWDFGDGTTAAVMNQIHAYADNGGHTVRLIVMDLHGAADTATQAVTVENWPPYIEGVAVSVPSMPAAVPMEAKASVTFSDPGVHDHPVVSVDWGDGLVSADTIHFYTAPGVYAVSVTVTDKDGAATTSYVQELLWAYDRSGDHGTAPGYEVIDLGTLGGRSAIPTSINNNGEVVGSSTAADGGSHAFLWTDGVMTDLAASLPCATTARVINDAGWIAGALSKESENSLTVWRNGTVTTFKTGGEDNGAWPVAVDEAGRVLLNIGGHEYGTAGLWRNGELTPLGGLLGRYAEARSMNARGQVVGNSAYQEAGAARYAVHAFLWEGGVMKDLGDLGGFACANVPERECGHSGALDINDGGAIVGTAAGSDQIERAVRWDAGGGAARDLGFGDRSRAVAINERGQIAGYNSDELGRPRESFFRDADGEVTNLGSLGGGGTQVVALNEAGQLAGNSTTAGGDIHPFVWTREKGILDLGTGGFGASGVGAFVTGINDRGDVIGYVVACRDPQAFWCTTHGSPVVRALLWRVKTPSGVAKR